MWSEHFKDLDNLDEIVENQIKFDMVLISGLNEYTQIMKELNKSLEYLSHGGVILIRNFRPM